MQFTFKPMLELIQVSNATLEKITRTNVEILNSFSKAYVETSKAYLDASNSCCKLYEESAASASKKS